MGFDRQWAYRDNLQEKYSQQGEKGPNHNNDCVPATFSNILHAYGYLHTQPSWWDAGEYPAGYLGPTSYAAMIDWMKKNSVGVGADFPNPPEVRISNPVDTLAGIDAAGQAGFAIAVNAYSDGNGVLQPRVTGILHVVAVTGLNDLVVVILNPEHNTREVIDRASFKLMTQGKDAGWLAVFARPLPLDPALAPVVPVTPPVPPVPVIPPVVPPAPPQLDYKALWQAAVDAHDEVQRLLTAREQDLADELQRNTNLAADLETVRQVLAAMTKDRDKWKTTAEKAFPVQTVPTGKPDSWPVALLKAIFGPH